MIKDLTKKLESSFLSCEKDAETILRKLFVTEGRYSDALKKLLVIQNKDCLTQAGNAAKYKEIIDKKSVADLIEEGYISFSPKIKSLEHEEIKSYIIIKFDSFTPNFENPYYRDCIVSFEIFCHSDYWELENFQVRPYKIAGYIDGILNKSKLSGIGTLNFFSGQEIVLNEDLSGFVLNYQATHGNDDKIPVQGE